jgi:hypothetical protein
MLELLVTAESTTTVYDIHPFSSLLYRLPSEVFESGGTIAVLVQRLDYTEQLRFLSGL